MKKTIAKLMAAAMVLSAVPAVTMPAFVSNAAGSTSATNTTTATYQSQFLGGEGNVIAAADGEIFSYYLPAVVNKNVVFKDDTRVSSDDFDVRVVNADLPAEVASNVKLTKVVTNNLVHVKASLDVAKMTSAQKTQFVDAVKKGTNTFKVAIKRKNIAVDDDASTNEDYGPIGSGNTFTTKHGTVKTWTFADAANRVYNDSLEIISDKKYTIGGSYDGGKIKSGVSDEDNYLMDRNVYAKISKTTSDGLAEVELLKQDKNETNKLKDNDQLRGNLLRLNVVKIGGVEYKVGKLGSQALKEAKMKKIQLKNCSKVGKGALRKCKQLRNVNLKDKNKVRKIHNKAFYDCKNLRSVSIDARKLNTVGKDAFGKVKKNCKIKLKASKSKYNDCVKKIKKSGAKNVKYSRIAP